MQETLLTSQEARQGKATLPREHARCILNEKHQKVARWLVYFVRRVWEPMSHIPSRTATALKCAKFRYFFRSRLFSNKYNGYVVSNGAIQERETDREIECGRGRKQGEQSLSKLWSSLCHPKLFSHYFFKLLFHWYFNLPFWNTVILLQKLSNFSTKFAKNHRDRSNTHVKFLLWCKIHFIIIFSQHFHPFHIMNLKNEIWSIALLNINLNNP